MLLDFLTAVFLSFAERLGLCPKTTPRQDSTAYMMDAIDESLLDLTAEYRANNHLSQARHLAVTERRFPGYREALNRERARVRRPAL